MNLGTQLLDFPRGVFSGDPVALQSPSHRPRMGELGTDFQKSRITFIFYVGESISRTAIIYIDPIFALSLRRLFIIEEPRRIHDLGVYVMARLANNKTVPEEVTAGESSCWLDQVQ